MSAGIVLDKSVVAHGVQERNDEIRGALLEALRSGRAVFTDVTVLEMRVSARSASDDQRMSATLLRRGRIEPLERGDVARADEVQRELVRRGQHRGVGIPDLLVAAIAERTGAEVLHVDRAFERIADVTGQAVRWAGSPAA